MFSFDGVKIEEDPFNSLLNPDCTINHCITSFYDQDSNEDIIQAKCSTSEVISPPPRLSVTSSTP